MRFSIDSALDKLNLLSGSAFLNIYADSPVSCSIASAPSGKFQSIPLSTKVQEAAEFGKYLKFVLQYEQKIVTESVNYFDFYCLWLYSSPPFLVCCVLSLFRKKILKKSLVAWSFSRNL